MVPFKAGEHSFAVLHLYASFNDTFIVRMICRADLLGSMSLMGIGVAACD